jgi:signal transduction histidine kinase
MAQHSMRARFMVARIGARERRSHLPIGRDRSGTAARTVSDVWKAGVVGVVALAAVAAAVVTGPLISIAAAVAVLAVVLLRLGSAGAVASGIAASVVSLGVTALLPFLRPPPLHNVAALCLLSETLAAMVLLAVAVRRASAPAAVVVGGICGGALTVLPLRVAVDSAVPPTAVEVLALCLLGSTAAFVAAGAGGYLRVLDRRRVEAVLEMRRAERLAFARDLHDFIGHDLTGIVLEAQAAQLVPERATAALRRIEELGASALTSMDHTVRVLHEPATADAPVGGLADLADVVRRFRADGVVTLHVDAGLVETVPREIGAIAYRVVVESLTNVRRHATHATAVRVAVAVSAGPTLEVSVTDDGTSAVTGRDPGRSGLGLVGLTERVESAGGTLTAGPAAPRGWRVRASMPLPADVAAEAVDA